MADADEFCAEISSMSVKERLNVWPAVTGAGQMPAWP